MAKISGSRHVASFFEQLVSQLRMVFLVKSRQPVRFLAELLIPVALMCALIGIKTLTDQTTSAAATYVNETQEVPDADSLLSAGWYLANFVDFYNHGFANMAYVCTESDITGLSTTDLLGVFTYGLGSICEMPKFVIIPEDASNVDASQAAQDFYEFWTSANPTLLSQSRFDTVDELISDSSDLENYIKGDVYGTEERPRISLAVVFKSASPDWSYYIRVNKTSTSSDDNVPTASTSSTEDLERGSTDYTQEYRVSGFLTVQQAVDEFILMQEASLQNVSLNVNLLAMPTLAYKSDPFWDDVGSSFPIFLVLSLLFPLAMIILELVSFKETKTRELMFIMGLKPTAYVLAWVIFYLFFYIIIAGVLTGISMINIFVYASPSVIFVYYMLFLFASLAYAFFIAAIFERTTLAIIVGLLIYFIGYFLFTPLSDSDSPYGAQVIVSLIPSAAFSFGTLPFIEYEGSLTPLTWDNAGISTDSDYTMMTCLGMMICDTILYFALALYLDAVIPTSGGSARMKWYWPLFCGCLWPRRHGAVDSKKYVDAVKHQSELEQSLVEDESANFEQVPKALQDLRSEGRCVMINGLTKTYKTERGKLNANDSVSFTIYEGQILALLGHNGAGKTTLSNLLTGVISPTHGDAYIGGNRISSDMAAIRGSLGVCPQANILFPNLTVLEHFKIYAGIKGVPKNEMDKAISEMIAEVGLTPKTNALSKSLSGGMKRKLHLGIALLGNSKLVILDEPTSGQDPYSRTFTWKTIERFREGRTIILTTHYMDEADLLGDRIAIMSEGKLRCIGTSLYLKKIFGVGYQMTIEKADDGNEANRVEVVNMVARHVPAAVVLSDVGTEIMLQLPLAASPKFQPMLAELERNADRLGIVNVGISVTSLENVFLRVAEGTQNVFERSESMLSVERLASTLSDEGIEHSKANNRKKKKDEKKSNEMDLEQQNLSGGEELAYLNQLSEDQKEAVAKRGSSMMVHVGAILHKRVRYAKRDRTAWCCQLLIPLVFLVIGFVAMSASFNTTVDPYWFDADTDGWNVGTGYDTPIPFNLGQGESISASATTSWIDNLTIPRVDLSQSFGNVGETATYCRPTQLDNELAYYMYLILGTQMTVSTLEAMYQGSVASSCTASSIYNASTLAFSNDLLNTTYVAKGSRYGALLFNIVPSNVFGSTQSSSSAISSLEAEYTITFNYTGVHAAPLLMNRANAALLQAIGSSATISAANYPLPNTKAQDAVTEGFTALAATLALAIAFSFVPSYYAVFIVREKEQRSWHQQLLNGIKPLAYWTANWIFDFCTYLVPMVITWILLFAFDVTVLKEEFGAVVIIFIFYGISVTSFTYCCTFAFNNFKYSQFGMILINLLGGMVLVIVAFIMAFIDTTYEINDGLCYVYRLLPSFCFSYGLMNVANREVLNLLYNTVDRGGNPSDPVTYGVFSTSIAGLDIIYLIVESFVYTGLLVLLQTRFRNGLCCANGMGSCFRGSTCSTCKHACPRTKASTTFPDTLQNSQDPSASDEDDDVIAERQRVENLDPRNEKSSDVVMLQHARKVYPGTAITPDKIAVKDLSFGIHPYECFGLLGINGAGKSTTMGMISGEHPPSSGHVYIDGFDIVQQTVRAQQSIGYCPQFDALFDRLTGREHLEFYGRVKGIPDKVLKPLIESTLREMNLSIHADKLSMTYSGGNKRKLSVAIASLGTPAIIMLDEPSAGVDPAARRFLLDVITRLAKRTSVLLTTHSMEEAEAVSTRIAIMVDGRLQCLGSAHHLKTKYGSGYQLEVNLRVPLQTDIERVAHHEFGLSLEDTVNEHGVMTALQNAGAMGFYERSFCERGSAATLYQQLTVGAGSIRVDNLAEWLLTERAFEHLDKTLEERFPGHTLLERVGLRLRFNLPSQPGLQLSDMFRIIENSREKAGIEGYGLGVTSLEHIFNNFAARQALVDGGYED